jgi:hypothetical protein
VAEVAVPPQVRVPRVPVSAAAAAEVVVVPPQVRQPAALYPPRRHPRK